MHELSIARSLADFVCEQVSEFDAARERVSIVRVRIGALSGIVPHALRSAYRAAIVGTRLESSQLEIETVDLIVWCAQCKEERLLREAGSLRCPVCHTRARQIIQGRELEIASIEVVDAVTGEPFTTAASNPTNTPAAATADPSGPPTNS